MMPTMAENGELLVIDKLSYCIREPRRGEVVIASSVSDPDRDVCKRVVAVVRNGSIVARIDTDGRQAGDRVTVPNQWGLRRRTVIVPPGSVWLEGDNASNSSDSRNYGPVPIAMVQGRIIQRVRAI